MRILDLASRVWLLGSGYRGLVQAWESAVVLGIGSGLGWGWAIVLDSVLLICFGIFRRLQDTYMVFVRPGFLRVEAL